MEHLSATNDLKEDHTMVRRLGIVVEKCSAKLYAYQDVPMEDIKIISVIIEEFVDRFHHGKEEKAYFPETKDKDHYEEDIRKFLIEHELGRRIAKMLRRQIDSWKKGTDSREAIARFLKSYSVFIMDHTAKEDKFFNKVEEKNSISKEEDTTLIKHYENCLNVSGGRIRVEQMKKLIYYLENRDWMS